MPSAAASTAGTTGGQPVAFTGAPGETNVMTTGVEAFCSPIPAFHCGVIRWILNDSAAAVTATGDCTQLDAHTAACPPSALTVDGGDMNDIVTGPPPGCPGFPYGCGFAQKWGVRLLGGAGDDTVIGGSGDDTLDGGLGADSISGGSEGTDQAVFTDHVHMVPEPGCHGFCVFVPDGGATVTIDDVANDGATDYDAAGAAAGAAADNVKSDVENVVGSDEADTLVGNGANNGLDGRGGNDVVVGGAGADALFGGAGNDAMQSKDGVADNVQCGDGADDSANRDGADSLSACERTSPLNVTPPAISGTARDGETLTAQTSDTDWSGTSPFTYAYQWHRCDANGANCQDVGANSSTFALGHADAGMSLNVTVTASNSTGNGGADSALTGVIAAIPPQNTAAPTISGTEREGETLTVHTSETDWSGTPPFTYSYQWYRCDGDALNCAPIAGALTASYILSHDDVGHRLHARVTAVNATGSGSGATKETQPTGVIEPAPTTGATAPAPLDTRISKSRVRKRRATFRLAATGGTAPLSLECRLDRKAFRACASPRTYRRLKRGKHTFQARARDATGAVDLTPATKRFKVKR